MSAVIRIQNISKSFGKFQALSDVSFDVPANSIFGLLGQNGAGKTTLFSIVANFLNASGGSIEVLGVPVTNVSALNGRMSILPQDAAFQKNITILAQLTLFGQLAGLSHAAAKQNAIEGLEKVGLKNYAKSTINKLSHGMAKRVGIAQAFLGNPEVILLDEPTSGLDPSNAKQIRDLVRQLKSHATVVISSHNLTELQDLCSDLAVLHKGKLLYSGQMENFVRGGRELTLEFSRVLTDSEVAAFKALPGLTKVMQDFQTYTLVFDLPAGQTWEHIVDKTLRLCQEQGLLPRQFREGNTLESRFLQMTS